MVGLTRHHRRGGRWGSLSGAKNHRVERGRLACRHRDGDVVQPVTHRIGGSGGERGGGHVRNSHRPNNGDNSGGGGGGAVDSLRCVGAAVL